MRTRYRGTALVAFTAAIATSCTSSPTPSSTPPAASPTTAAQPGEEALTAYRAFWTVVDAAFAAPRSKSWDADLERLASGQALTSARTDVANYARLPAHVQGLIHRSPTVASSTTNRVSILDCIDLGDSRVVSDTTGAVLNDLENRVQRFRSRSDVVADASGRWRVDHTAPALDEPC